ncbi:hypothetical protein AAZX31_06G226200 [Glycine max]|nr:hypothetical protein JHK87_016284 [Glycine soja]
MSMKYSPLPREAPNSKVAMMLPENSSLEDSNDATKALAMLFCCWMGKLQELIENSGQSSSETFQTMFVKDKSGRVRCHGRTTTPTLLKRNKEISEIEKRHAEEVKELNDKIQEIEEKCNREMAAAEEKCCQEMAAMEQKIQFLVKIVLNQSIRI